VDYLQYIPITEENHDRAGEENVSPHEKLTHIEVSFL
jgi:hypothetical protein